MATLNFNPAEVERDERSFEPIPNGDYQMQVIASELKPTKAGNGTILKLTCQVTTGPHANRLVWDNINIQNPNPDTERWAKQSLAQLTEAVGLSFCGDSEDLHFKPFKARVAIRPAEGQWDAQNQIKKYMSLNAGPPHIAPASAFKPVAQAVHSIAETNGQTAVPNVVPGKRWAPPTKPRI